MNEELADLIRNLFAGERVVTVHRAFIRAFGGVTTALFLDQCLYWTPRGREGGGWFYKSAAEWTEETGLTRREQEVARAALRAAGVLEERRAEGGMDRTLHYRVDLQAVARLLDSGRMEPPDPTDASATSDTWTRQKQQMEAPETASLKGTQPTTKPTQERTPGGGARRAGPPGPTEPLEESGRGPGTGQGGAQPGTAATPEPPATRDASATAGGVQGHPGAIPRRHPEPAEHRNPPRRGPGVTALALARWLYREQGQDIPPMAALRAEGEFARQLIEATGGDAAARAELTRQRAGRKTPLRMSWAWDNYRARRANEATAAEPERMPAPVVASLPPAAPGASPTDRLWRRVLEEVAETTLASNVQRWLAPTRLESWEGGVAVVRCPNAVVAAQVEQRFARQITMALEDVGGVESAVVRYIDGSGG